MELSFFVTLNIDAREENEMQQGLCYERGFHFHQHVTQLCSCITISCMENNLKIISFTQPGAFPPDFNYFYALSFDQFAHLHIDQFAHLTVQFDSLTVKP